MPLVLTDKIVYNQRFQVSTDPNAISDSGVSEVENYIKGVSLRNPDWRMLLPPDYDPYDYKKDRLPQLPDDWEWTAKSDGKKVLSDGNKYSGRFTRRYSQFVYKTTKISVPVDWLEKMGNIVASHSEKNAGYSIDFTKDLHSWRAGEFGDGGSCFWQSRASARDVMKKHDCFAIRFYMGNDPVNKVSYERGTARAWVVPNVPEQGMLTVFNGYGFAGDPTRVIVRVLVQHLENTLNMKNAIHYREVRLLNNNSADGNLYINGSRAFIVGEAEVCKKYTEIDLKWKDNVLCQCYECNDSIYEGDDYHEHNGRYYCDDCFHDNFSSCQHCDTYVPQEDINELTVQTADGTDTQYLCDRCYDNVSVTCGHCGDVVHEDDAIYLDGETEYVCEQCYEEETSSCTNCNNLFYTHNLTEHGEDEHGDTIIHCAVCAADLVEEAV
jgi:hypothetical protein